MRRHLAAQAQDRDEQVPREEGKKEAPEEGDHERDPRRDPCSPDSRRTQLEDLRCGIQIALRTQDDNVLASVGDPFHQPHVLRKRIQGCTIAEERLDPNVAAGEIVEEETDGDGQLENGGVVVSDEVIIKIDVEALLETELKRASAKANPA